MESDVAYSAKFYEFLDWAEKNRTKLAYIVAGVAVLALIVSYFFWRSGKIEADAGRALSQAFVPQATAPAPGMPVPHNPEAYLKVAAEYPNTKAGARALLMAAGSFYAQGKYNDAQTQFEKFIREHRSSPFVSEATLGVAAALEAQGKTDEALTSYRNVIDRYPGQVVVPQAKFALARLYDAQQKPEQALPLYEDVARNEPYTSLGSESGMRAEEIKLKHPELAATPAPGPSTVITSAGATLTNAAVILTNAASPATNQ